MEYIFLVAGALLGVVAQQAYNWLKVQNGDRQTQRARQSRTLPVQKESRRRIIAFYASRQWPEALYQTVHIVPGTILPLLSSPFKLRGRIDPYTESVMTL